MSRPPSLVLPSNSMPWGRWIQDTEQATSASIQAMTQDASSAGSLFAARADLLAAQIAGVQNVSTQQTVEIPPYTRSVPAGSFDGPYRMMESPTLTFTPPRPVGDYQVILICYMNAQQTAGTGGLDFSWINMMVNNGKVYRQPPLEENRISPTAQNLSKTSSIAAWSRTSNGTPTSVKFGMDVSPFDAKTVNFSGCTITAVYIGAL